MSEKTDTEFDYEIVNDKIRPIAEKLIQKYDELSHINPDKILFVVNHLCLLFPRFPSTTKPLRMATSCGTASPL